MKCSYCKTNLSNQSSFNRHLDSDIHKHNLKNPYYTFIKETKNIPLVIQNLIWEFTYINNISADGKKEYRVFDYIEDGYVWKAYDIIFRRKMKPICSCCGFDLYNEYAVT